MFAVAFARARVAYTSEAASKLVLWADTKVEVSLGWNLAVKAKNARRNSSEAGGRI